MVSKSRIYTKTGDSGKTSLYGGDRVTKVHQRIISIGTIDELNASLGIVASLVKTKKLRSLIENIQSDLFIIGAELANPKTNQEISETNINFLEEYIDQMDSKLKPLINFILPGGSVAASQAHLARSICRRAEREVVKLTDKEKINPEIQKYLNRLSDFLFVLARYINKVTKSKEVIWKIK